MAANLLKVDVVADVASIRRAFRKFERPEFERRVAIALNKTAGQAKAEVGVEMRRVFDRPTPYALGGTVVAVARAGRLQAEVKLKDNPFGRGTPASKFLSPQIAGGVRPLKRFEQALRKAKYYSRAQSLKAKRGAVDFGTPRQVLPDGYQIAPGPALPLDPFGNIPRGEIIRVLSYFEAFATAGFRSNTSFARREKLRRGTKATKRGSGKTGFEYFVVHPGDRARGRKLAPGIWRRQTTGAQKGIQPWLMFVRPPSYRPRLAFAGTVQRVVARDFAGNLRQLLTT